MQRGSTAKYTDKQKREAEHIAEEYEQRGVSEKEAKRRAWATVNAMPGGGNRSGSGRGGAINLAPAQMGGRKGGEAAVARKAVRTRGCGDMQPREVKKVTVRERNIQTLAVRAAARRHARHGA
jgi:plasmid stabilization system protein ParE